MFKNMFLILIMLFRHNRPPVKRRLSTNKDVHALDVACNASIVV